MIRNTSKKCLLAFFTFLLVHTIPYAANKTIEECVTQTSWEVAIGDHCDSETAFAFLNVDDDLLTADEISQCFIPDFNRWGWTTFLDFSEATGQASYEMDIYSGAGQCDLTKGTDVGSVNVIYSDGTLTFDYDLDGFVLSESHIYVGYNPYPTKPNGQETVAPGQYTYVDSTVGNLSSYSVSLPVDGDAFYIIIHGVTQGANCNDCPDEDSDGICDEDDICPGFDDTIDTDGDGIPDGCDDEQCPDSDGDGICDDDDICPGFDDTIDSDGDGIPDGCDNGAFSIEENVSTYPIPFNEVINVKYSFDYDTPVIIELFDMKGIKLESQKINTYRKGTTAVSKINLSTKSNQLYLLRLTTSKGQITKKIVSFN